MKRSAVFILAVALTLGPVSSAFATGKQIICWDSVSGSYVPFYGARQNAMRYQALIDQYQIRYAGKINQVELFNYHPRAGKFYNYKLMLCHCGTANLSATFASNYKGTPVTVANLSTFTISGVQRYWFDLGMTTTTFTYNNTDHLLFEVQWKGDNGVDVAVDTGSMAAGYHRLYAFDASATTGTLNRYTCYTRLSFGAYTALGPTSLGRVKAMYE